MVPWEKKRKAMMKAKESTSSLPQPPLAHTSGTVQHSLTSAVHQAATQSLPS